MGRVESISSARRVNESPKFEHFQLNFAYTSVRCHQLTAVSLIQTVESNTFSSVGIAHDLKEVIWHRNRAIERDIGSIDVTHASNDEQSGAIQRCVAEPHKRLVLQALPRLLIELPELRCHVAEIVRRLLCGVAVAHNSRRCQMPSIEGGAPNRAAVTRLLNTCSQQIWIAEEILPSRDVVRCIFTRNTIRGPKRINHDIVVQNADEALTANRRRWRQPGSSCSHVHEEMLPALTETKRRRAIGYQEHCENYRKQ